MEDLETFRLETSRTFPLVAPPDGGHLPTLHVPLYRIA